MRQVRGGRTVALATLFERHHTRVYGYCLRMTGNRAAAEDLVQDVFMKMLKYKATFKDDSELVPWMFGIARNSCLAHLKTPRQSTICRRRRLQSEDGDRGRARRAARRAPERARAAGVAAPAGRAARGARALSRFEYKS